MVYTISAVLLLTSGKITTNFSFKVIKRFIINFIMNNENFKSGVKIKKTEPEPSLNNLHKFYFWVLEEFKYIAIHCRLKLQCWNSLVESHTLVHCQANRIKQENNRIILDEIKLWKLAIDLNIRIWMKFYSFINWDKIACQSNWHPN